MSYYYHQYVQIFANSTNAECADIIILTPHVFLTQADVKSMVL